MNEGTLAFVWTAVVLALRAIRQRPLRSALTAFGILVGIAAVTIVVALAQGAGKVVSGNIDTLGSNALMVQPKPVPKSGLRDEERPSLLHDDDAEAISREAPSVLHTAPFVSGQQQIVFGNANASTTIAGSSRDLFPVRDFHTTRGEMWSVSAETNHDRVCVIGETVRTELFGPEDPVGRTVRIGRFPFRVVGLLAKKGQSPFGGDQDDVVLMPLSTLRSKIVRTRPGQLHRILLSAANEGAVDAAKREVTEVLRQRHHILDGAPDDFEVHTQEEFRKTQTEILGVLQMLLLGIAAVSLVVGGIGVMNIMLVSVAERTREIGIRLAIGARAADIRAQFLVEAVVLTLLGGLGGTLAAAASVAALRDALELPMRVSPSALGVAILTSTVIGLVFGFFPARRAAQMDPIDALRTD
jgi:putative ABC transport system permease protein